MARLRQHASGRQFGEPVPSSRELMEELGVGPVTVRRAVARLVTEGLLTTRPGSGTFVSQAPAKARADTAWQHVALGASPVEMAGLDTLERTGQEPVLQLASARPDAALRPETRLAAAMARAARRPDAWSAPPIVGLRDLRSWFATEIGADREDVLVAPGAQGAMSAVMRGLLPAGSSVLFSVPTYPGAVAIARSAGLVAVPVPTDENGVRPELLERAFATTGARLVYLQPTYANPDGTILSEDRREQVIAIATAAGAFILEDDWARWLGHGDVPPPPLLREDVDGHVITVLSLSKTIAASLRVGAIVARGPVMQRLAGMRMVDDFYVSRPLQETAIELVSGAGWQTHLHTLASALRHRMQTLVSALHRHMPEAQFIVPRGGPNLWLELPRQVDEMRMVERALVAGVAVNPGHIFAIGETGAPHLRLSVAAIEQGAIEEAIRRLASTI